MRAGIRRICPVEGIGVLVTVSDAAEAETDRFAEAGVHVIRA